MNRTDFTPPVGLSPRRGLAAEGQAQFERAIVSGLLRCAVPPEAGGLGGTPAMLAEGARALGRASPAAGWILWAQRLAIEILVHTPNVGLREYLLPDLLCGERAGTVPLPLGTDGVTRDAARAPAIEAAGSVVAQPGAQSLHLSGHFPCVPHLQWQGFVVALPVRRGTRTTWFLLRGEESGLHAGIDLGPPCPPGSRSAALALDAVFCRADEVLGDGSLTQRLDAVATALAEGLVGT